MIQNLLKLVFGALLACGITGTMLPARQEQDVYSEEESSYGTRFFEQLRAIFGKFRDSDLQRVFDGAHPIQCSELVGRKGEWRPVAFFNEDRKLGDWCRESLQQVKSDLVVYTFKGTCSGDQGSVDVATEFPTTESLDAFYQRSIKLEDVDITVNDPVKASLNPKTMAYTFDLPYLFQTEQRGTLRTYSFNAPNRNSSYAPEVTSHWECKLVSSEDVTFRFLICRTATIPRGPAARNTKYEPYFGASAFFILSDGMEAQTKVRVLGTASSEEPTETSTPANTPGRPSLIRKGKPNPPDK